MKEYEILVDRQMSKSIKILLSNPLILRMPDIIGMFRLMSDTSTLAAGLSINIRDQLSTL